MSGANNSYNTQGPTQNIGQKFSGFLNSTFGTPKPTPTYSAPTPNGQPIQQGTNTGLISAQHPPAPQGNVASHTVVTDPATGKTTTKQTFTPAQESQNTNVTGVLAPSTQNPNGLAPNNPNNIYNTSTGVLNNNDPNNSNYVNPNPPTPPAPQTPVGQIAGQIQTSANAANDPNSRISGAYQNLQNLQNEDATQEKAIQGSPIPLEFQQGRGQVLANQYGTQEQAAETGISNTLVGQQQQISGLGTAGGLVAPQPYGITTTPYNPATDTFGTMPGGAGGATNAGIVQGQIGAGQTYAQNQAIIGKVQAQIPNLVSAIQKDNFNPTDVTYLNALTNWAKGTLSDSSIPEVQGSLNDIVGGLSQVLGVPSSAGSDFRLQFAGSIVNALQSGKSIQDAVNFATQQAMAGNQGYLAGAQGATSQGTQNNTPISSQVVPGNYTMVNGKWVYNTQ